MRATEFEFHNRFWIIAVLFGLSFWVFPLVDHSNLAETIIQRVRPAMNPNSLEYRFQLQGVFVSGAMLVFIAAWLRTWATAYLKAGVVHDAELHSEQLVASGPFRYTRNPLYLATLLMTAGMSLLASSSGAAFMMIAMTLFLYRLILREETGLLAANAESYARYAAAVPRLLPRSTPGVPSGSARPAWGQAFAAELFFWMFGLAELLFAITLQLMWFAGAMFLSFGSYAFFLILMKRSRQ